MLRVPFFALAREAARRALGQRPFDVQLVAALALDDGQVIEMLTGEGKTLTAVMPAALNALTGRGVHVLTFNDYLARRDAEWMGPVYRRLGISVGYVQQGMAPAARRAAYLADVTYVTAKEAGFDHLRDLLAMDAGGLVHRPFHVALVDEADSLMIDEARVPLVIAGSVERDVSLAPRLAALVASLSPGIHFDTDEYGRDIELTEAGIEHVEKALGCGGLAQRREPLDPHRVELRAARQGPSAPRRRLHRARRPHRDRRRVHRPRGRGSSLARWTAGGTRSQGGPRAAAGWTHPRVDHAAALPARLPPALRHDRNGAGLGRRVAAVVRARRGRHSHASPDGAHAIATI